MPAWGASHDDESLWPVVAFMTILPNIDADTYQAMLASAEGIGHHASDGDDHQDAASESGGRHDGDQPHQDQPGYGEETEHKHSSHSHQDEESAREKKTQ